MGEEEESSRRSTDCDYTLLCAVRNPKISLFFYLFLFEFAKKHILLDVEPKLIFKIFFNKFRNSTIFWNFGNL
jgi:hypothetical protein